MHTLMTFTILAFPFQERNDLNQILTCDRLTRPQSAPPPFICALDPALGTGLSFHVTGLGHGLVSRHITEAQSGPCTGACSLLGVCYLHDHMLKLNLLDHEKHVGGEELRPASISHQPAVSESVEISRAI